ncbi:hypothetical protein GCM10025734_38080 [Kitasatospora paranensis]
MIFANETRSGAVDAAELFEALRGAAKRGSFRGLGAHYARTGRAMTGADPTSGNLHHRGLESPGRSRFTEAVPDPYRAAQTPGDESRSS